MSVLGLLASLAIGAIPAGAAADADAAVAPRPPNVLFIVIDDLNDWVGALGGHPQAKTPNIDRLAEGGTLFTRAYTPAPACSPARTAALTGVLPSTSGVYYNWQPWRTALPDAVSLPQHFKQNGYRVERRGKVFHEETPDTASWHLEVPRGPNPQPAGKPLSGLRNLSYLDWGPVDAPDTEMDDRGIADSAAAFLALEHSEPFFLAVGLYRPHPPWHVPPRYFEPFDERSVTLPLVQDGDLKDVPRAGREFARRKDHAKIVKSGNWPRAVAAYLASVAFADAMVGRVIDALEAGPNARDTIVVLWSDHGYHLGEKMHWRKFALWEEATRVPLVISLPRSARNAPGEPRVGQRSGRTVSLLDLYPTLVALAGLPARAGLEGRSLVPLLDDPAAEWDHPVVSTAGPGNHAVRSERWRYIRYADGSEELYDHHSDPQEWNNLAGDPERAALKASLAAWIPKHDAAPSLRPIRKPAGDESDDGP